MKYCKKCDSTKDLSEFGKDKNRDDGLQFYCKECCKATTKRYREANKEKYYASAKRWAKENPDKVKAYRQRDFEANKERILAKRREYYLKNRERILEYKKSYGKINRGKRNAIEAKRYAEKLNRTPNWLTKAQKEEIEQFYWLAKDLYRVTGETYHVDHIVPMQGKNISGLHVPWNLQILPSDLNASKGNKYEEDSIYS